MSISKSGYKYQSGTNAKRKRGECRVPKCTQDRRSKVNPALRGKDGAQVCQGHWLVCRDVPDDPIFWSLFDAGKIRAANELDPEAGCANLYPAPPPTRD